MRPTLRWFARVLILFLAFLPLAYFVIAPNSEKADREQYAVLSAYLQPGLTGYSHDLGDTKGTIIILEDSVFSDQAIEKSKLQQYFFLVSATLRRTRSLSRTTLANFLVANLRDRKFDKRFSISANYILASKQQTSKWPTAEFYRMFPENYGYVTFSRIGFNSHLTEAFFYTEHLCGLCGDGKFVHMRKVEGKWVIVEELGTWIS
jgi:hypothetical protein